jgi:hypothetical protein
MRQMQTAARLIFFIGNGVHGMSKTPAYREETEPARTKMNFHVMIFVRREILIFGSHVDR